jgi:G:T-mismatch repair DNA endonuclease (very short patch repair protein)
MELYINSSTPVMIFCPTDNHGLFKQRPNDHLNKKQGCPKCGNIQAHAKTNYTNKQIVEEFKKIHGNKYNYSKVIYENNKIPVIIVCNKHGEFKQRPNNHKNGQGCPECKKDNFGNRRRVLKKDFLLKAHRRHNGKYIYDDYCGMSKKIKIICPTHGLFLQMAQKHVNGHGCPECSKTKKLTKEAFLKKAKTKHGIEKYDYSLITNIKNSKTHIPIICKKHGIFSQKPNNHLNGYGCPTCGNLTSKMQKQLYQFLKENFKNKKISLEKKITLSKCKFVKADICFDNENIIIEYYGDYWHCNPDKYDANYFHQRKKMYAKDIWKYDKIRKSQIEKLGYKLIIVWESKYKNQKEKTIQNIVKEIKFKQQGTI